MKRFILMGVCLWFALTIVGRASAQTLEPYKVGAILDITGPAAFLGDPEKKTLDMVGEEINKQGGINGHKLELIIEDTQGREDLAKNLINKLIKKEKVCAIIGTSRTGTTMAIIKDANEAKIPLISCAAAEEIVVPVAERKWIFKVAPQDSNAARLIFEHMQKLGYTKVAIITATEGFGKAGRDQLKKLAPEYKIEIIMDETYEPQAVDMTPQLTKIKGSAAQAVINWSIVPAQSLISKNMKQLMMSIPLYQSHGFGNIKYAQAAGASAEGIIFPCGRLLAVDSLPAQHPQKAVLAAYKKAYESRFKDNVSTFGGHAYDALWLVNNALKAVGPDSAKIRDFLENSKGFVGTGGVFNFSAQDHNGLDKNAFEMLTVKNGRFVLLPR